MVGFQPEESNITYGARMAWQRQVLAQAAS